MITKCPKCKKNIKLDIPNVLRQNIEIKIGEIQEMIKYDPLTDAQKICLEFNMLPMLKDLLINDH